MRILLCWSLLLCACRSGQERVRELSVPPTALSRFGDPSLEPQASVKRSVDPRTGQLLREWSQLPDGSKHGRERVWRRDGSREWEKEWDKGEPAGAWRSWYANGQLRSECFYSGAGVERTLSFWHENGARRMQGPAIQGVRTGRWRVWFAEGALAEEGEYEQGLRTGLWQVRNRADEPFRAVDFSSSLTEPSS